MQTVNERGKSGQPISQNGQFVQLNNLLTVDLVTTSITLDGHGEEKTFFPLDVLSIYCLFYVLHIHRSSF